MHCLSNVLLEFDEKIYAQEKGVVTGENNSVAIANITLHFMIKQIPEINQLTFIFKRYIDDMIYITRDQTVYYKNPTYQNFQRVQFRTDFQGNRYQG